MTDKLLTQLNEFIDYCIKSEYDKSVLIEERDQRKEELQNTAGAADYVAFVNELTRQADIERNDDVLSEQDFPL